MRTLKSEARNSKQIRVSKSKGLKRADQRQTELVDASPRENNESLRLCALAPLRLIPWFQKSSWFRQTNLTQRRKGAKTQRVLLRLPLADHRVLNCPGNQVLDISQSNFEFVSDFANQMFTRPPVTQD